MKKVHHIYKDLLHLKSARSFNAVRKLMDRWHIEPCKGNAEANMKYCMKENDFIEIGESQDKEKEMIYILQNKWFWKGGR